MAAPKYMTLVSGIRALIAAVATGGSGSEERVVSTNASGLIDESFFPAGHGADQVNAPCSEDLAAGDQINLWVDSGAVKMRKADASAALAGKRAHGFVNAAYTSGQTARAFRGGNNTGLTGMTPGTMYLSETPGQVTATPPTTAGAIVQEVGYAMSSTLLEQKIEDPTVL